MTFLNNIHECYYKLSHNGLENIASKKFGVEFCSIISYIYIMLWAKSPFFFFFFLL